MDLGELDFVKVKDLKNKFGSQIVKNLVIRNEGCRKVADITYFDIAESIYSVIKYHDT